MIEKPFDNLLEVLLQISNQTIKLTDLAMLNKNPFNIDQHRVLSAQRSDSSGLKISALSTH